MSLTPRKNKKGKRGMIAVWPAEGRDLRSVASEALYVGSPEHKGYVNPVLGEAPHPKSDKSQCEKFPASKWCEFTRLLRIAIERDGLHRRSAGPRGLAALRMGLV